MILDATCHISYSCKSAIPAIMMLRPRSGSGQWITREEYVSLNHTPRLWSTRTILATCASG